MERINNKTDRVIYLVKGGTGKRYLINLLLAGRTAHSAQQILLNIGKKQFPLCKISKVSGRSKLLKQPKIIHRVEYTVSHKKSLETVEHYKTSE